VPQRTQEIIIIITITGINTDPAAQRPLHEEVLVFGVELGGSWGLEVRLQETLPQGRHWRRNATKRRHSYGRMQGQQRPIEQSGKGLCMLLPKCVKNELPTLLLGSFRSFVDAVRKSHSLNPVDPKSPPGPAPLLSELGGRRQISVG